MAAIWKRPPSHLLQGKRAENAARWFLTLRGLVLIERNFHCRGGEIDLVMQTRSLGLTTCKPINVFVEVRFRALGFEPALLSIGPQKIARVTHAATVYLKKNPALLRQPCRFDVVTVTKRHGWHRCQWMKDAWQIDECFS